ncbi:hypothetical protein OOZ15_03490 [Galbibacter sp. EGI 63066]|uniref:hypothetical protein n=1 Tax=Galbibacter sp. EGI 63066 TaxID=2993559 RepID=UPI002248A0DC|nr:hypothetical protein [Galbibacter sp. EGI 63066]MCX2678994.1 hypothetical protein [Galbibacter sp. EGI 63066]
MARREVDSGAMRRKTEGSENPKPLVKNKRLLFKPKDCVYQNTPFSAYGGFIPLFV